MKVKMSCFMHHKTRFSHHVWWKCDDKIMKMEKWGFKSWISSLSWKFYRNLVKNDSKFSNWGLKTSKLSISTINSQNSSLLMLFYWNFTKMSALSPSQHTLFIQFASHSRPHQLLQISTFKLHFRCLSNEFYQHRKSFNVHGNHLQSFRALLLHCWANPSTFSL